MEKEKETLRILTYKNCGFCYHLLRSDIMKENAFTLEEDKYCFGYIHFETPRKYTNVKYIS